MFSKEQRDNLARTLGISTEDQEILDSSSDHPFNCRCRQCLDWWVLMGPDGGEAGKYGPFSQEEVLARARTTGKETEGLL